MDFDIKKILGKLSRGGGANDGTSSWAKDAERVIKEEEIFQSLVSHPGFEILIDGLRREFMDNLSKVVSSDPELKAIAFLYRKVYGSKGATDKIKEHISSYLTPDEIQSIESASPTDS
jgi:hypothetical protein